MPWEPDGTFQRVYSWEADANNGLLIDATRMDTDTDDIVNGLAQLRQQVQSGSMQWGGTAVGTASAPSITVAPAPTALAAGNRYLFLPGAANTGPATLQVNTLAAVPLRNRGPLVGGELQPGVAVTVVYDGANFQIEGGVSHITALNPGAGLTGGGVAGPLTLGLVIPVAVSSGGLGVTGLAAHGLVVGQGTAPVTTVAPGAANTVLIASGPIADPSFGALSPLLDTLFGNTQGTIAFRGASGWAGFAPGPVGALLQTQGPGANLGWSTAAGTGTISGVSPGRGLTGGGTSGSVTLALAVPVAITDGGTNAGDAVTALANLGGAPLASPVFTGAPQAPTPSIGDNSQAIATTAFVQSLAASALPLMDGAAAAGTGSTWARADHAHPSDTSRAPLASPVFTGAPKAPTPTAGDNSTNIATTAFVAAAAFLPLAGGTLTGQLTAPRYRVTAGGTGSAAEYDLYNTTPLVTAGGLWRIDVGSAGNFNLNLNTAAAGDFSTTMPVMQSTPAGVMTIGASGGAADPFGLYVDSGKTARINFTVGGTRTWYAGVDSGGRFALVDGSASGTPTRLSIDTNGLVSIPSGTVASPGPPPSDMRGGGSGGGIFNYLTCFNQFMFNAYWGASGQNYLQSGYTAAQIQMSQSTGEIDFYNTSNTGTAGAAVSLTLVASIGTGGAISSRAGSNTGFNFYDRSGSGHYWSLNAYNDQCYLYSSQWGGNVLRIDQNGGFNFQSSNGNVLPQNDHTIWCGVSGFAWSGVQSYNYGTSSDARLKRDIAPVPAVALAAVKALSPVTFRWLHEEGDAAPLHHGFVAGHVREVLGEGFGGWWRDAVSGLENLAYNDLVAVLWQAVRELSDEVAALKAAA